MRELILHWRSYNCSRGRTIPPPRSATCQINEREQSLMLFSLKFEIYTQVPEEVVSVLRQFFAPHNRKFFAMVGQQFDWPEQ